MADSFEKKVHISELYELHHRHDKELHNATGYKDNILENSLSDYIYRNDNMSGFLERITPLVIQMVDSNVILRNWFNHTVSKYYDRHNN